MLLNSWTTVDRVEKLSEEFAYSRLDLRDKATEAFGKALIEGTRPVIVRALLATAPAVDRTASILKGRDVQSGDLVEEGFLSAQRARIVFAVTKQEVQLRSCG